MSVPIPEVRLVRGRRLSQSKGYTNSVLVSIRKIFIGHRTITSTYHKNFSLRSCHLDHILSHLHNQLNSNDHWLCDYLASEISTAALNYGFGYNGFELTVLATVTYVVPVSSLSIMETALKVLRMVRLGTKAEELKSLDMETESCSICLENLVSCSKAPTRMSCSHVFHKGCLLEWLFRKNTCPLCRTVLWY